MRQNASQRCTRLQILSLYKRPKMTFRDCKGHPLVLVLRRTHRGKIFTSCREKVDGAFVGVPTFLASFVDATDGVLSFTGLMEEMSDASKVAHLQPGSR